MAHRITAASIWTAFVAVLVALLGSLGFGAKAAPATATAATGAGATVPSRRAAAAVRPARPMGRRSWRAMMRGGSLPPTIKQRIRAEAHGKAPSVRRSTTAAASATGTATASASASATASSSASASASASMAGAGSGVGRDEFGLVA
ncbi:DUF6344 domain-containing protein [Streptomyces sp. NPDC056485]|uniref:DUF6344 domain-containing protein n=1 Tax=Streptomyces sp. NPDC056485 TaxID=3345834 RepID=UPI00369C3ED2